MAGTMNFGVLGALEVRLAEQVFILRGPKLRKVLALLALRINEVVCLDALIDELWAGEPPGSAVTTVRTHVYHLRKWLAALPADDASRPYIDSRPNGYLLEAPEQCVDADVFRLLHLRGRGQLRARQMEDAADTFHQALALWRGPVLADVQQGPVLEPLAAALSGLRDQVLESRLEADIRRGRHREIVDELRALVAAQPFNEWMHTQLINALNQSGRRAEALVAYRSLRTLLKRELGVEPSSEVQRLQDQILKGVV
ncbi:BTAD domain-containing putative transcriptional regulator [Streptomyces sp. NPDC091387]|uniref:AfsR/SARP family transcriptional regulator n=1 Tax=Streptomyces sp. NPDC091387 TaxID=3365998 RepID=UPI0037F9743F